MRKALLVLLTISALVALASAAYLWANALVNSIYGYRTPLKGSPLLTEDIHPALTSQVVLVLIDGLRYDTSLQMPYLNVLRQQGAQAQMIAHPPSNAQTAWTTLISGATPEINDIPLFDRTYEWLEPISVDHMFSAVNRAGLTAGLAGFYWWEKLIPADLLYTKYFVDTADAAADERVIDRASVFIKEFQPNFLLVHLRQLDTVAQNYGGSSQEYQEAALRCDAQVRALGAAMDLQHSVLVVVSSYGHVDAGGHGGAEAVVLNTPLVLAGQSILPRNHGSFDPEDLAPTLSALLGAPTPASAQGRIRSEMLRMGDLESAEKWVALARQRVRIGNVYVGSIAGGALPDTAEADMLVAISSLQVKNYKSAAELARLSVQEATREMAQTRWLRVRKERWSRAGPVALAVLVPLVLLWARRSRRLFWSTLAALLATAIYHILFMQQGNSYSFTHVPAGGLAATWVPSLQRAAIALCAGGIIVIWQAWRDQESSIFAVILRTYSYAALQLYFVGLVVAACTFWNGLRFSWYLPDFTVAYVHLTVLMQFMAVALLAVPLPLLIVPLQRGLLALAQRTSTGSQRSRTTRASGRRLR
jgi:hypothetical protein